MKTCLATLYTSHFNGFINYTTSTFNTFCKIHNISFESCDKLIDLNLHPSWNKILYIKKCFEYYDRVFWCDADSLYIGNNQFKPIYDEYPLILNMDSNGICLSHFIINNTPYNQKLLDTLLFLGDVKDDTKFGIGPKWEQNTLKAILENFSIDYKTFSPKIITDIFFESRTPDTFFFHYPIMENDKRTQLIKQHYNEL